MTQRNPIAIEGRLVIRVADILQRTGIQSKMEFSGTLGVFAKVVAEAAPAEGDILGYWAALVRDASHPPLPLGG